MWRLPAEMTSTMLTRLSQMASNNPNKSAAATRAYISNNEDDDFSPNPTPVDQLMDPAAPHNQTPAPAAPSGGNPEDYRFSVGKLPAWAKKQVEGQVGDKQNGQNKGVDFPKG